MTPIRYFVNRKGNPSVHAAFGTGEPTMCRDMKIQFADGSLGYEPPTIGKWYMAGPMPSGFAYYALGKYMGCGVFMDDDEDVSTDMHLACYIVEQ